MTVEVMLVRIWTRTEGLGPGILLVEFYAEAYKHDNDVRLVSYAV